MVNDVFKILRILDDLQLLDSSNEEIYIQRANIYSKKDNHEAAVLLLHQALKEIDVISCEHGFELGYGLAGFSVGVKRHSY